MTAAQPRKRTIRNGKIHEGFGEKEASEPSDASLTVLGVDATPTDQVFCPACEGYMPCDQMGLPLQESHRQHRLPEPTGLAAYVAADKSRDYYDALERSRAIRLERLRAEYRPTMPPEILHAWASDVTEALIPTEKPPVESNDRRFGL